MRRKSCIFPILVTLIIITSPLYGLKLQIRHGVPIVDGVYVNGHGPYRFLLDTGTNVNMIDAAIAKEIGMTAAFQVDLASAAGKTPVSGSDDNEIELSPIKADGQKFIYSALDAIHKSSPDVQGVLGEWFLSRFDYTLDLRGGRLEFGKQDRPGRRSIYKIVNARPVVATSLGDLVLDSGASRLALFGARAGVPTGANGMLRTLAGSQEVGIVSGEVLQIDGRRIWSGDAVAIPARPEPGVDGLLPLSVFKTVYFCNSQGYVAFE